MKSNLPVLASSALFVLFSAGPVRAELVELVFDIMKGTLESGEKIKVAGFGNFEVKSKSDRRGRNPQTGEEITITARRILTFKPSQVLKNAINSN